MDVLDHSCSKLGFGGKMCIDGTKKFEEEMDDSYLLPVAGYQLSEEFIKSKFSEIKAVNVSLLKKEIPCLIISVEKNRKGHIKELHEQICALNEAEGVKISYR
jgi:4-hydroxy-3-polyprenylbenzoate decarboxylase